jgi:hypothetical protein
MEEAGSDAQREEKKNREEEWRELDDMTGKGRSKGPGKGREMSIEGEPQEDRMTNPESCIFASL